jgi:hypothetical protein
MALRRSSPLPSLFCINSDLCRPQTTHYFAPASSCTCLASCSPLTPSTVLYLFCRTMLRRIVQKHPGPAICRRATITRRVATSFSYGDKKTSYRRDRDDGAGHLRVATPTSSSAVTQSYERYSSSEALFHALPDHHNYIGDIIHGQSSNEAINPFLNRDQAHNDDGGFWELFKAISTLNDRHHDFNPTLSMSINLPDTEIYAEEEEEEEEETMTSSGADIEKVTTKVQVDDPPQQDTLISLSRKLDKAIKKSCTNSVLEVFEQERTSSEKELCDRQLGRIITFLAGQDVVMSFEATKYYAQKCKAKGRMAPLYLYHYMMSGLKSCTNQSVVENLVVDIQEHILEEYSDGKKAVYKYILLPQLAQIVARLDYNSSAKPLVDYILDEKYPLLNPDIYESLLKTAWRHPFAREDWSPKLPYHRLLSELVSCGHRPQPDVVTKVLRTYYPYRGEWFERDATDLV